MYLYCHLLSCLFSTTAIFSWSWGNIGFQEWKYGIPRVEIWDSKIGDMGFQEWKYGINQFWHSNFLNYSRLIIVIKDPLTTHAVHFISDKLIAAYSDHNLFISVVTSHFTIMNELQSH